MPTRVRTMNVSLPPRLGKFIDGLVKSGRYGSASEVVREGVRILHDREENLRRLRREIDRGIAQLDRGEGIPAEQALRQLRARLRRRKSA